MKRRIALLLSAAAVAGSVAMFSQASPVAAHTDACAGEGTAKLGAGLVYPGVQTNARNTSFFFNFTVGACASGTNLTASGTVSGWCGLSSGAGVTNSGHRFVWAGPLGTLALQGEVRGAVNAVPNATLGDSCTAKPGADDFLVNGAAALAHCSVTKSKSSTNVANNFTVHTKVCV